MRTMVFTWQCNNEKCPLNDYKRWESEYSPEEFNGVKGKGVTSQVSDTFERPVFKNYDHTKKHDNGHHECPVCKKPVSKVSMGLLDFDDCFDN